MVSVMMGGRYPSIDGSSGSPWAKWNQATVSSATPVLTTTSAAKSDQRSAARQGGRGGGSPVSTSRGVAAGCVGGRRGARDGRLRHGRRTLLAAPAAFNAGGGAGPGG